jgi:LysM repeat protein
MTKWKHRISFVAVSGLLLMAALLAGCTLTGAEAPPLTTVGESPATQEPTEVIPTPTLIPTIDIIGTQTALAPPAVETQEPTEETSEAVTPTPEVTPTATAASQGGDPNCPKTHTVQPGENLYRIALKYGISVSELAAANGITNPDKVQVGQVLVVPRCGTGGGSSGGGAGGQRTHVVQPGETMYSIARKYGVSVDALAKANGIVEPYLIYVGQVLIIPDSE